MLLAVEQIDESGNMNRVQDQWLASTFLSEFLRGSQSSLEDERMSKGGSHESWERGGAGF